MQITYLDNLSQLFRNPLNILQRIGSLLVGFHSPCLLNIFDCQRTRWCLNEVNIQHSFSQIVYI